jgi:hypothetical protein
MFAAFRHPDVTVAGVLPEEAAEFQRHQGWYRVSDWAELPQFNLAAYGPDAPDLDAPTPAPDPEPTAKPAVKKTKE